MDIAFAARELDLMTVLWEHGPSTVTEVRERLHDDLAYNTVLTILRKLETKGYVGHRAEGRAFRYHALVEREAASTSALGRLLRTLFRGSPELLLTQLVSDKSLTNKDLARMQRLLAERSAALRKRR
jgi:BlaI family penicillinase repressor